MAAGPFALRLGPRLAGPTVASATRGGGRGSGRPTASRALRDNVVEFDPKIKRVSHVRQTTAMSYVKGKPLKVSKKPNKDHRLWIRKDSAGSGKKALCLVNTVSKLPNEKEAVYGALDRWTAFEPEFPIIAAAKALEILKKRRKWLQIIQVTKWLMSNGQVLTWTTYDTLLLALSMDGRVDEAESIWNTILQTYTRSVPKKLFSRMIQIYNTRHLPDKVLEIYADMEELGVRPDEDTTRRIGRAFVTSGQENKQKSVLEKYLKKWKYIHFNGERVRVRRAGPLA